MIDFDEQYKKWQEECIRELQEQRHDVTMEDIEICEDGQIHFKGNFYITDSIVTPWKDSEFYVEC